MTTGPNLRTPWEIVFLCDRYPSPKIGQSQRTSWLYRELARQWSLMVPEDTLKMIEFGAFYVAPVRPRLKVISLNTNFCYSSNWWVKFLLSSTSSCSFLFFQSHCPSLCYFNLFPSFLCLFFLPCILLLFFSSYCPLPYDIPTIDNLPFNWFTISLILWKSFVVWLGNCFLVLLKLSVEIPRIHSCHFLIICFAFQLLSQNK